MRPNREVKSAKRALEVLELLEMLNTSASVKEIASRLGYPQSSTSILLSGLRQLGYLRYDTETRTYALSLRIALIGSGLRFGGRTTSTIFKLVEYVRDKTRLSTSVVTRSEVYMQYVYTMKRDGLGLVGYEPGVLIPICHTSSGIALLSRYSDFEIGKFVRRLGAQQSNEYQPPRLEKVLQDVDRFQSDGYITLSNQVIPNRSSVSILLPFTDRCGESLALSVRGIPKVLSPQTDQVVRVMSDAVAMFDAD